MKKYIVRFLLAAVTAVLSVGVYFGCTDDEANMFFDLTGRWTGWGRSNDGGGRLELELIQDTTGYVTGFGYTYDEKTDTMAFSGTVSDGHMTLVGYNMQCRPTINLNVSSDGLKMVGTAQDLDSASCNIDPIELLFYKVQEPTVDITGSWNGTHAGPEGSGNFLMIVTQTGSNVTGNIYDTGDTTTISGRVLGNVFEGYLGFIECPVMLLLEVNGNNMNGLYVSNACADHGTVNASRVTGKRAK